MPFPASRRPILPWALFPFQSRARSPPARVRTEVHATVRRAVRSGSRVACTARCSFAASPLPAPGSGTEAPLPVARVDDLVACRLPPPARRAKALLANGFRRLVSRPSRVCRARRVLEVPERLSPAACLQRPGARHCQPPARVPKRPRLRLAPTRVEDSPCVARRSLEAPKRSSPAACIRRSKTLGCATVNHCSGCRSARCRSSRRLASSS